VQLDFCINIPNPQNYNDNKDNNNEYFPLCQRKLMSHINVTTTPLENKTNSYPMYDGLCLPQEDAPVEGLWVRCGAFTTILSDAVAPLAVVLDVSGME
jgi:hypothetical protein